MRACRRGRSTVPASRRSKRRPARPRPATSITSSSRAPATASPSPRPKRNSKKTLPPTTRPGKRPAASRRTPAGNNYERGASKRAYLVLRAASKARNFMNRLAVLGHPVSHSRSPAMHIAALTELGMAGEWSYEAIDVAPDAFEERVRTMFEEDFVGANVTVPHKGAALALADELSETAREIGAANTLVFADGEVRADNTDAGGFLAALPSSPQGKRALVLGAGGAARAVVWGLLCEGAAVSVWNRTELRSRHLCEELGGEATADPDQSAFELIVNTTAVGLAGEDPFAEL